MFKTGWFFRRIGGGRDNPIGPVGKGRHRRDIALRLPIVAITLCAAAAAQAHAILLESRPAVGATVARGDARVVLRFNCRIDPARSRLVLEDETRKQPTTLAVDPASPPDTIAARARLQAGNYKLRWQVLAIDGHISRGDVAFSVAD